MIADVAVDALPEYRGLVTQASNASILAKSSRARGEPFEAAIYWMEAGRAHTELGSRLIEHGYIWEGAQDLLYAVNDFLETGDYRPAEPLVERLQSGPLAEVVQSDETLRRSLADLLRSLNSRKRALETAHEELRKQMVTPRGAARLKLGWLTRTLPQFAGVSDFHWFAAEKYLSQGQSQQALRHLQICVKLKPGDRALRFMYVSHLADAERWDDALTESSDAVLRFPGDAHIRFEAGWVRLLLFRRNRRQRSTLEEARRHFEAGLSAERVPADMRVTLLLAYALCERLSGRAELAREALQKAARESHPPTSYRIGLMINAPASELERHLINSEVPRLRSNYAAPLAAVG